MNGQLRETVKGEDGEPLRISAGVIDGLNFEPVDGYYYYYDTNSYDLDTAHGGIWHPRTGMVTIVPGDGAKDYDNVLKIYLWTFQNHSKLDVERRLDVDDKVKGYTISYEAYNPETKKNETFTYEATSFLVAQPQMVPTNTEVTITPICESPYEVERWSTADAYSAVTLRGERDQQGTNAYGNKVYLTVGNTAYVSVTLYIESLREVKVPTDDELEDGEPSDNPDAPYFDDLKAVIVDCVNNSKQHGDESFALMEDRFTVSKLKGDSASGYYAEVTITNPQAYVDTYNAIYPNYTHTLSESQDKLVITLRWVVENKESVWKADGPATIKVTCEDEPEPGIDPTEPDPSKLTDAVNVYCSTFPDTHKQEVYNILRTQDNDLDVEWSKGETTATITIKDPDPYVDKYNEDNTPQDKDNPHVFDEDWKNNDLTISLKWVDDAWTVEDPADIYVCDKYKDGTPIKVSVYLDGEDVTAKWEKYLTLGGNTDKTKDFVYTYNESTNTIECTYVYQTYNSADMVIEAKDAYKLQALDADLMYGSAGSGGYNTTTGVLDNVAGGSEVKIYLATKYSVEYYVDGKVSETYTDDKIYTVLDDAVPEEDLTKIPNEELVDEEKDDLNPKNGMQKVYAVVWVADDLEDTITLESNTGLNAWYPTEDTVDGTELGATVGLAAILAGKDNYTVDGNVIKFFGKTETVVENPDVTVTKSLTEIIRNGEEVTSIDANTELKVGDEITYEIKVENTGNVALSDLTVTDEFSGYAEPGVVEENGTQVTGVTWQKGETETDPNWTLTITDIDLVVGEEKTYTYTYTVNQADADKNLTNTAAVSGDGIDPDDEKDDDEHPVKDDGTVTIYPAAITIYKGGDSGSTSVVEDDKGTIAENNSLPTPGFYFDLPEAVNKAVSDYYGVPSAEAVDLSRFITITAKAEDGSDRVWNLEKYGEGETSFTTIDGQEHYIYKLVAGDEQDPVRVQFTDDQGNFVTSDDFTLEDAMCETYTMQIYTDSVDTSTLTIKVEIPKKDDVPAQTFRCGYGATQTATLTVRHVNGEQEEVVTDAVTAITDVAQENTPLENAYVVADSDAVFNVNDSSVSVNQDSVSLLFDDLTTSAAGTNKAVERLLAIAEDKSGLTGTIEQQAKYLNLVDADNGNAWLTAEEDVTIYWPYPEGTDKSTEFSLLHFDGIDREMAIEDLVSEVESVTPEPMTITKDDYGISFTTKTFSPFVLMWETEQPSSGEDKPSGGDDGNNNNNNNSNTNEQTTTVNVTNEAPAPAAAPAAVAVPQTSDDMPIGALTAAAAAAAFVVLVVVRKRRHGKD